MINYIIKIKKIKNKKDIIKMYEDLKKIKIFTISLNTLNVKKNKFLKFIIVFSISIKKHWIYENYSKEYTLNEKKINFFTIILKLKNILENKKYLKIGNNMKKIYHFLKFYNVNLKGIKFDVFLFYYLYKNYKINLIENKNEISFIKKFYKNKLSKDDEKTVFESILSYKTYLYSLKYFIKEKEQKKIFESIDIPLITVLASMENYGVLINLKLLDNLFKKIKIKIKKIELKIYKIAEEKFNILSTKQLQRILFKKIGLKPIKLTKKKFFSTDKSSLKKLKKKHVISEMILNFRNLKKIISTYILNIYKLTNKKTNRIHTTYTQTITKTSRISSIKPNLQNIPIQKITGTSIRELFIAQKEWLLLSADYSQIELKIIAHLSKDINLIKLLKEGKDIHKNTASQIFNEKYNNISKKQRELAKKVNYSILYGISPFGLSNQLNVSIEEAKKYIKNFFLCYPNILNYMKKINIFSKKNGYVQTLFGRKLFMNDVKNNNIFFRKKKERFFINAPIQGTASEIIKKSMIEIKKLILNKNKKDIKMIIQIHDELIFEVKKKYIYQLSKKIKKTMEQIICLDIPLNVSMKIGKNWDNIKLIKKNDII